MSDSRSFIDDLIYGKGSARRYMQSSPILYDVWSKFAVDPWSKQDLLLTPYRGNKPGELCNMLRRMLPQDRLLNSDAAWREGNLGLDDIAYNQSDVAALLSFPETVRVVLPLTGWWVKEVHDKLRPKGKGKAVKDPLEIVLQREKDRMIEALKDFREGSLRQYRDLTPDIVWLVQMIGSLAILRNQTPRGDKPQPPNTYYEAGDVVDMVRDLMNNLLIYQGDSSKLDPMVHVVNCNRMAETSIKRSTKAIKSDAALRLFEIKCSRLTWAIVDSGVDARHPAFMGHKPDENWSKNTRVKATYDFSFIRHLLSPSQLNKDNENLPIRLREAIAASEEAAKKAAHDLAEKEAEAATEIGTETEEGTAKKSAAKSKKKKKKKNLWKTGSAAAKKQVPFKEEKPLHQEFDDLQRALQKGRDLDWGLLRPFLQIPYDETYEPPRNDHGTHVGGILASGGLEQEIKGVCPDINLIDFRVLDEKGKGNEFNVIAALQFIRYLNGSEDHMVIHGANLSLSINHDVANYACGRTPVCDEADRLVSSGVCVVAAAGNKGYIKYQTAEGPREGYHTISITDPGNAEKVITVGATHRYRPHTYGVSYFSSRGPTGDGRLKPDLVAPGEKITAPAPDGEWRVKDGTSMAAPHVSGAAALLMARHREMVGRPEKIKGILCKTATDLGRERYFQGHGMLDILRALQSV